MTLALEPAAMHTPSPLQRDAQAPAQVSWGVRQGLAYGALGLPLAFVALPLYVLLPNLYAKTYGMALTTLGAVLLGARLLDAVIDPWLGRWVDRGLGQDPWRLWRLSVWPALALALGVAALLLPPVDQLSATGLWVWVALGLVWTYTAYSLLTLSHQAWGANLGGDEVLRGRIVAWREGLGLAGVVLASVLPGLAGLPATVAGLALCLAGAWWVWRHSPAPGRVDSVADGLPQVPVWQPLSHPGFLRLWGVFVLNGVASAIPATLVYFFMQDRLQLPVAWQSACLGVYFLAAALGMPAWLALVPRLGLAHSWCLGMGLSVAVFAWVSQLQAGDHVAYAVICALSGLALGADLALPGALLAGLLPAARPQGQAPTPDLHAGLALGWWNFAAKLNLALAAGLALPILAWWGYAPGVQTGAGVEALSWAYGLLPCGLKLGAAATLLVLARRGACLSSIRRMQ